MVQTQNIWVRHEANTHRSSTMMIIMDELGPEGYGIFWILWELLLEQPEHKYPLRLIPSIARQINTTPAKIQAVVTGYSLFDATNEEFFFSPALITLLSSMEEKKEEYRLKAKKGVLSKKKNMLDQLEELTDYIESKEARLSERNSSKHKQGAELSVSDSTKRIDKNRVEKNRVEKDLPESYISWRRIK